MIKKLLNKITYSLKFFFEFLQAIALFILQHDYFVFLGFMPIFYLIYRRVFYIRTPKNLLFNPEDVTLLQISVYLWLVAIFSYLLYRYCQKRWFPKEPKEPSSFARFWLRQWFLYLNRRAKSFYTLSRYIFPFSNRFLQNICILLSHYSRYLHIFVFITNALPRIIISIFFLLDIFYFHRFHYFYLSLYLLILPLIYRSLSYILLEYYIISMEVMKKYLIVEDIPNNENRILKKFSFVDPNNTDLEEYIKYLYYPIDNLPHLFDNMDTFKAKIMNILNPFVYLINIIGWGYLLFSALVIILI